jgi:fructose-bisphosphate aldolase class II
MSLCNLQKMLKKASEGKYAVGNFDVFNIEMLKGVVEAAEETRSPIILAYGEAFEELANIESFAPVMINMAREATVPVAVHLDHAVKLEFILRAVHSGFTSVMIDASDKPLKENIEITKRVVQICRTFNVSIEAELGHVSGIDGLYECDDYKYTDVREAKLFVDETDIDVLAIAIGTVHGVYKEAPNLNITRLQEVRKAIKQHIVLHGGSGLSEIDFINAIQNGVSKVNIHTDLTIAAMNCIHNNSGDLKLPYIKQCTKIVEAVKMETIKKMNIFGCFGKAD